MGQRVGTRMHDCYDGAEILPSIQGTIQANCCTYEDDPHGIDPALFHGVGLATFDHNEPRVGSTGLACMRPRGDAEPVIPGWTRPVCPYADNERVGRVTMPLESLSYEPVRYDADPTLDTERSQARYSNTVAHSTKARTQRRSEVWQEWLRGASEGRTVILIEELPRIAAGEEQAFIKTQALYQLDHDVTTLTIRGQACSLAVPLGDIQTICPAIDSMMILGKVEEMLDSSEKHRAIMLQYLQEDDRDGVPSRKRVCFVEESEDAKEQFVQALTALWLEKRNDHSMWF
eukprot:TRINITY_DN122331_c0_g1_i1.p1 TRINITY_DN122331_c0_g1~~TRINITY_DN122331_c0_g1_i1.p1  ORF type:complete len:288 (+),score=55.40 TRINITY_DN122331_c0_g1_i1:184-1047(+)